MMNGMKLGTEQQGSLKSFGDTSGNEYMHLSRKIENKIRNVAVTLNSQFSARNS